MTASQLEKLSRKYALVQRHGQDPHPMDDAQRRYVRRRDTEDGMVKIEAVLHPEEAELVWTMLNHAATQLAREPGAAERDDSAETRVVPSANPSPVLPSPVLPSPMLPSSVPGCRFRDPHGRLVAEVPAQAALADLGWPRLRAANEPLAIDADTIACGWDGSRIDYGMIIGHLVVADGLP
ncbi:MAG TPA: hypothetical protein VHN14_08060 [Kofleriaceae bacterium]|nr:hypothetical protein [Kofleriaceae bacterium]